MLWQIIITFLLFALPLVVAPLGVSFFETPKVIVGELLIEGLLLVYFLSKDQKFKWSKLQLVLTLSLFSLSLITLWSNQSPDLFGNAFRLQGPFLYWHLWLLSLLAARFGQPKQSFWVVISLIFLVSTSFFFGTNQAGRIIGSLGEPNSLAAIALFWGTYSLLLKNRLLKFGSIISAVGIILFSQSGSALVALVIVSLFLLISQKYQKVVLALILSLVLLVFSFILPWWEAHNLEGPKRYENRFEIWQTALSSGWQSPIWGHGFSSIQNSLHQTSVEVGNLVQYQFIDSSHNIFLDYWVMGGVVGLACLFGLLGLSLSALIKRDQIIILACLLGMIIMLNFNPLSMAVLIPFWWLIGQGFVPQKK